MFRLVTYLRFHDRSDDVLSGAVCGQAKLLIIEMEERFRLIIFQINHTRTGIRDNFTQINRSVGEYSPISTIYMRNKLSFLPVSTPC